MKFHERKYLREKRKKKIEKKRGRKFKDRDLREKAEKLNDTI